MQTNSKILIIAGANGCGKTTIVKSLLDNSKYKNYQYLCPDTFVKYGSIAEEANLSIEEKYLKAMQLCEKFRKAAVEKGDSFIIETVLSDKRKLTEFEEYKTKHNAFIEVVYVATKSSEVNKKRVAKRVQEGGHDVPEDKIHSRWRKSLDNLKELNALADEITIYDNTEDYNSKIMYQRIFPIENVSDEWILPYLIEDERSQAVELPHISFDEEFSPNYNSCKNEEISIVEDSQIKNETSLCDDTAK